MVHLFCECEKVSSIWKALLDLLLQNYDRNFILTNFEQLFGVPKELILF